MNTQPDLITGGPADVYIKRELSTEPKRRAPSAARLSRHPGAPLNGILWGRATVAGALSCYEENPPNNHQPGYV